MIAIMIINITNGQSLNSSLMMMMMMMIMSGSSSRSIYCVNYNHYK